MKYSRLKKSIAFLFLFLSSTTFGQLTEPRLQIPFGHSGEISYFDISGDSKMIATASGDRTVIIWDVKTGRELKTLFLNNPLQSVVFTADARSLITIETSGIEHMGTMIFRRWDVKTGALSKEYSFGGDFTSAVSPTNDIMLITSYAETRQKVSNNMSGIYNQGLSNLDLSKGNAATYDLVNNTVLNKFQIGFNASTGEMGTKKNDVRFIPSGNALYFMSAFGNMISFNNESDYSIKIWNVTNPASPSRIIKLKEHVNAISASRTNGFFAAGYNNKINLWNIDSESFRDSFNIEPNNVRHFDLSGDGKFLACYSTSKTNRNIDVWDVRSHKNLVKLFLPKAFHVHEIKFSPDGNFFAISQKNNVTLYDLQGNIIHVLEGHVKEITPLYFSENDRFISQKTFTKPEALGLMDTYSDQIKNLLGKSNNPEINERIKKALEESKIKIKDGPNPQIPIWDLATATMYRVPLSNNGEIIINGSKSKTGKDSVSADKKFMITGMDKLNPAISLITNKQDDGVYKDIINENFSNNIVLNTAGKYIQATGKIKLLINRSTHDTLTLFLLDSTDWIILNKEGYYKASKNAAALLHYVSKDDKVISFEQLDLKYNRPDLILESLESKDKKLIEAYRTTYSNRLERYGFDINSINKDFDIPETNFINEDRLQPNQTNKEIKLSVHANSNYSPLARLNIWVNEVPLFGSKGVIIDKKNNRSFDTSITVLLSDGKNKIETSVFNKAGFESYREPLYLNHISTTSVKQKIWFIGIGVNKYADPRHNNLKYTVDDIKSLTDKLVKKSGNININNLFNNEFTEENLAILKKKLMQVSVNDKVIFVYSGHGLLGKDKKYYLPVSSMNAADFNNPESKSISYEVMEDLLNSIPSRNKLFLIDACYSGINDPNRQTVLNDSVTTTQIMDELFTYIGRGTGATVIASSSGIGKSFESTAGTTGHGFFTQAILDAIDKFPSLKVSGLKNYILENVPLLSKNMQKPTVRSENREADFIVW